MKEITLERLLFADRLKEKGMNTRDAERICGWVFLDGARCGDEAAARTAGGLHLCAVHLTDWSRGVYKPIWLDLKTSIIFGGVTHGQRIF